MMRALILRGEWALANKLPTAARARGRGNICWFCVACEPVTACSLFAPCVSANAAGAAANSNTHMVKAVKTTPFFIVSYVAIYLAVYMVKFNSISPVEMLLQVSDAKALAYTKV